MELSSDYRQLNSGAHRKAAFNIQAPALTCHLAFWMPDQPTRAQRRADKGRKTQSGITSHSSEARLEWKNSIDDLIVSIIRRLRYARVDDDKLICNSIIENNIVLFAKPFDLTDLLDRKPTQIESSVLEGDYRLITVGGNYLQYCLSFLFELHTEYLRVTIVVQLGNSEGYDASTHLSDDKLIFSDIDANLDSLSKFLRAKSTDAQDVSRHLYIDLWERITSRFICVTPEQSKKVGSLFADFRGLVISDETRTFRDQLFRNDQNRYIPQWGDGSIMDLQAVIGDPHHHEITASYMLDGRALYLTNLGPQTPEDPLLRYTPLRFIVYAHQKDLSISEIGIVNKWQLGRFIDRMHVMGVVRLAALKDLMALRDCSRKLADLDEVEKNIRANHQELLGDAGLSREVVKGIRKHLRTMPNVDGGLFYRVERSRYYTTIFRKNVAALRIIRIEGFQPYDLFVERRLGPTFDFIDRLGVRYERALSHEARENQLYISLRENEIGTELRKLQNFGELILILILVPYYSLHLLDELNIATNIKPTRAVMICAICSSALTLYRLRSRETSWTKSSAYALFVFIITIVVLVAFQKLSVFSGLSLLEVLTVHV